MLPPPAISKFATYNRSDEVSSLWPPQATRATLTRKSGFCSPQSGWDQRALTAPNLTTFNANQVSEPVAITFMSGSIGTHVPPRLAANQQSISPTRRSNPALWGSSNSGRSAASSSSATAHPGKPPGGRPSRLFMVNPALQAVSRSPSKRQLRAFTSVAGDLSSTTQERTSIN